MVFRKYRITYTVINHSNYLAHEIDKLRKFAASAKGPSNVQVIASAPPMSRAKGVIVPSSEEQERLLHRLAQHVDLKSRGYNFSIMGGVLVEREGHARGLWRCAGTGFSWTPAGYNEPVHWAEDVEAALRYTLNLYSAV